MEEKSHSQLKTYFGWDIPQIIKFIFDKDGNKWTKDEVHDYHYKNVVESKRKILLGEMVQLGENKRVSEMSKAEFHKFRQDYVEHWRLKGLEIKNPPIKDHEIFR